MCYVIALYKYIFFMSTNLNQLSIRVIKILAESYNYALRRFVIKR